MKTAYSVTEAAGLLGLGRTTMYDLVQSGDVQHVRIGRRIVIPGWVLAELLGMPVEVAS